jgi:hypothetical protein
VTWRSPFVAHARGYSTGDGAGRLRVAFRERTADPPALDRVGFRDPEGRLVGERAVPAGVYELAVDLDPLAASDADGELVGFHDGHEVDAVPMFYH